MTERVLSVCSGDPISVERKNIPDREGTLYVRIVYVSNEPPEFNDSAGVVHGRWIMLNFTQSFAAAPDLRLKDKLLEERAGIFNWMLDGWERLSARGYFIQPESGKGVVAEIRAKSCKLASFVEDCCEVGPEWKVNVKELYGRWCDWCGHNGIKRSLGNNNFTKELLRAFPEPAETESGKTGKPGLVRPSSWAFAFGRGLQNDGTHAPKDVWDACPIIPFLPIKYRISLQ